VAFEEALVVDAVSLTEENMRYTVIDARYVRDFTIWTKFADGSEREIDLVDELWGPVFDPLKDVNYFRNFSVAEYSTILLAEWRGHCAGVSLREGARSRLSCSPALRASSHLASDL